MAFYGLKDATKDIDIILTSTDDLGNLKATLEALGYKEPEPVLITRAYNNMQTSSHKWDGSVVVGDQWAGNTRAFSFSSSFKIAAVLAF